ncbi:uncharacterized protein LOC122243711 [Penaeus japonicus]|uniref:uncharacterized protein LOC122243711 n=1 Tax=Penaeus japonicus TaxID=27405 RepID=UPI001C715F2B|nr:uncharacterized protein LOC122243711 [Penaeus japonicus]
MARSTRGHKQRLSRRRKGKTPRQDKTKPGSEAPLLIVRYSGAREGNSSESGAEAAEPGSEADRKGKFIEKFKEWYKGKDKKETGAIIINSHHLTSGLDSHGHHHHPHYHQPFVQPIIIGTGSSKGEDPVVITKPVTHYVTVAHPVAFTVTETVVQGHSTPTHVLIHTTLSTYMTPSHVYIQEPQTMQPVTISLGHSHETDWGWVGGSTGDDHVVYVMKPDAATHEAIVIQHPHIVTVPATKPAVTHTVMVQNTEPHVHGYVKGIFAGKGHFQVGRSMTVATPQYTATYSTSIGEEMSQLITAD